MGNEEVQRLRALFEELREICNTDYGPAAMGRVVDVVRRALPEVNVPRR